MPLFQFRHRPKKPKPVQPFSQFTDWDCLSAHYTWPVKAPIRVQDKMGSTICTFPPNAPVMEGYPILAINEGGCSMLTTKTASLIFMSSLLALKETRDPETGNLIYVQATVQALVDYSRERQKLKPKKPTRQPLPRSNPDAPICLDNKMAFPIYGGFFVVDRNGVLVGCVPTCSPMVDGYPLFIEFRTHRLFTPGQVQQLFQLPILEYKSDTLAWYYTLDWDSLTEDPCL